MVSKGFVLWLTGLSGSGKTTLGKRLYNYFKENTNQFAEFIDGELTRRFFEDDLGYTRKERMSNIKRIVFASMLLSDNNVVTIVANIAPYYEVRDFIRRHIKRYCQIYLKASVEECEKRDVKGHYQKARRGELKNFVGIDDVYEEPRNPDLIIDTVKDSKDENFLKIINFLKTKGLIER